MKRRYEIFLKRWRYRGFTLVEVVASLMLLGTLLVGILAAHRRHTEQVRGAQARLAAVAAADKLLAEWREQGMWGASDSFGPVKDHRDMAWRWTVVASQDLQPLGAAIGRLEILDTSSTEEGPLASVDILVSDAAAIVTHDLR